MAKIVKREAPPGVCGSVEVRDAVHGTIFIDGRLARVLKHPLVQRLAWILQTGLVFQVFPGATHNRFGHVAGTSHLARKFLESLHTNGWRERQKGKIADSFDPYPGQAVPFHALPQALFDQLSFLAQTAGLVHDLGHGPLSHAFDGFAPFQAQVAELVRQDLVVSPRFAGLVPYWSVLFPEEGDAKARIPHETMSVLFFAQIWAEVNRDASLAYLPVAIASILIDGKVSAQETMIPDELRPWMLFLRNIISGSPWDVDRQDYLKRDTHYTGAKYGNTDDHYLKGALCWWDGEHYRLGWRHSALRGIEAFVLARGYMFGQVYNHKTYAAAWAMTGRIAKLAQQHGLDVMGSPGPRSWNELSERYRHLSDELFFKALMGFEVVVPSEVGPSYVIKVDHGEIRTIARRLRERAFWKRVGDFSCETRQEAENLLAHMRASFPNDTFFLGRGDPRVFKGFEEAAPVLFRDRSGIYAVPADHRTWFDVSASLRGIRDATAMRWRVYWENVKDHPQSLVTLQTAFCRLHSQFLGGSLEL